MKNEKKEYAVGEVFRQDGKVYQCVEDEQCEGCAFRFNSDCCSPYCSSVTRVDSRSVKFIAVTEPAEGMLYRAENGRMYRLAEGSHWDHWCACDDDPERSCAELDMAVFGGRGPRWYWAPTTDYAPASDESSKPVESPKRHIELAVVKVERDNVTFRIVEQTRRCNGFSRQDHPRVFKAANGFNLRSAGVPEWLPLDSALYCRGKGKAQDLCEITCTAVEFAQICEAVAEYNATDGWVDLFRFDGNEFDCKMHAFGNFFRTKEEAEAALERVKQALKK